MPVRQELASWDPLQDYDAKDQELVERIRKQNIRNILRSYTGAFDLFSELIQNALDAVDDRATNENIDYQPMLWIHVDIQNQTLIVADNGTGLTDDELRYFMKPNASLKTSGKTRGNKGVGATFVAYGFNYLEIATKVGDFQYAGVLENGRRWVDGKVAIKPKVREVDFGEYLFDDPYRGSSFTVKLVGDDIKPKDLGWIGATNADQWDVVLRINTPLGGIHLFEQNTPRTKCLLKVTDKDGVVTQKTIDRCEYFYPHEIDGKNALLSKLLSHQQKANKLGKPVVWSQELSRLTGIYDIFSAEDILSGTGVIRPQLTDSQRELMQLYGPDVYVFFGYSTQHWDDFNDRTVRLRKKQRILRGGLQLATQTMVQGDLITIPLTSSIGYQNTTHVIVHFRNADPDTGRKGFQQELVELAETIAITTVGVFKGWKERLRKDTGTSSIQADAERYEWIKNQEEHAQKSPLAISGKGLFKPEEKIPIMSIPLLEQDVVALFHQLLAAGVIRGFQILATSGHQQYDGVFKIHYEEPLDRFIYNPESNPLGIPGGDVAVIPTAPMILEYKYDVDALIADFGRENKFERHVDLVVAWKVGEKWREEYQIVPLLHNNYIHDREFHGVTHKFLDDKTGARVFWGIILEELIEYLKNPDGIQQYLEEKYINY